MVFKDNLASRTFRVPLGWISRFGSLIFASFVLCTFSLLFAVKYYRTAHKGDPGRVQELEQELSEAKAVNESLQAKLNAKPLALAPAPVPAPVTPTAKPTSVTTTAPAPIPTVTVTVTPTAVATTPAATGVPLAAPGAALLFTDLPPISRSEHSAPITIQQPKVSWKGRTLAVNFAIQYSGTDGGNQQGRIVILARGPESLAVYPDGAFGAGGDPGPLIAPERGEYFSVSRYRETRAEFATARGGAVFKQIEILIFGQGSPGQPTPLLIHQRLAVEGKAPPPPAEQHRIPKPAPTATAAPKTDGAHTPSNPGSDIGAPAPTAGTPASGGTPAGDSGAANPGAPTGTQPGGE